MVYFSCVLTYTRSVQPKKFHLNETKKHSEYMFSVDGFVVLPPSHTDKRKSCFSDNKKSKIKLLFFFVHDEVCFVLTNESKFNLITLFVKTFFFGLSLFLHKG